MTNQDSFDVLSLSTEARGVKRKKSKLLPEVKAMKATTSTNPQTPADEKVALKTCRHVN